MKSVSGFVLLFSIVVYEGTGAFLNEPSCQHGDPLPDYYCGRGGKPCESEYYCHVHPADAWAVCCPKGVVKRSVSQIDTLKNQINNLQTLLQDIEKKENAEKETADETIEHAKESRMTDTSGAASTHDSKMSLEDKLSPKEISILMALKDTLQKQKLKEAKEKEALREELALKGSFYDQPVKGHADDVTVLKALASKLSKKRTDKEQEPVSKDTAENQVAKSKPGDSDDLHGDVQPKEGKFTLFREEVLAQVEDRLLQDMDFALKMGFSIEEILTDLQQKEKRFEELEIEELKSEIKNLRKPRD